MSDTNETIGVNDGGYALPGGVPMGVFRDPPGFIEGEDYVRRELVEAEEACKCAIGTICQECEDQVGEASAATATVLRTLLGEAHIAHDDARTLINKQVEKIVKEVSDSLYRAASDIEAAGGAYPFDHDVRTMLLQSDPSDWLPVVVPTFQSALAGATPSPVGKCADPTAPCIDTPAGGIPYYPPDPPEGCGVAHRTAGGVSSWESVPCPPEPPIPPVVVVPPVIPPTAPPPLPPVIIIPPTVPTPPTWPPAPIPPACPAQQCCAPSDIDIQVTGGNPTIVLPPPQSPPPPPPPPMPPTCPESPDVAVQVSNPITVNVPGDEIPPRDGVPDTFRGERDRSSDPTNWSNVGACILLEEFIPKWNDRYEPPLGGEVTGADPRTSWFTRAVSPFRRLLTEPIETILDGAAKVAAAVISAPALLAEGAYSLVYDLFEGLSPQTVANKGTAKYLGGKLGMAKWAETVSGFPMVYLNQGTQYSFQYANPQYLPTQPALDSLFLTNRIDEETWTCLTRAQGNIPGWARQVRNMGQGQPDVNEITQLYLRKKLTPEQYFERMRRFGYIHPEYVAEKIELATQIPTQSDLLRMMVRDASNEEIVTKYQYDIGFDKAFVGKLKDWSEAQGVPAEVFKYFWRSHWVIPSNTQLYEMAHRFRPDRPEVERWDAAAALASGPAALAALGPRPIVVTLADVRKALEVNDQAPAWVDPLVGISYHPLTRTDAVRAYEIGSISSNDLYHVMRDNGYNERDARTLTSFYEQQANRRASNATGVLTIRKVVKLYKGYAMTRRDAEQELSRLIKEPQRVTDLLDGAERERGYEHNERMLKILKKRYMTGLISDDALALNLNQVGVQNIDIADMMFRWSMEKARVDKAPTAAQLCKWYKLRLLNLDEYRSRLVGMGYTDEDVLRIMAECGAKK